MGTTRRGPALFVAALATALAMAANGAAAAEVITLKPRPHVSLRLLVDQAPGAKAVAILFSGGHGRVNIKNDGTFKGLAGNFLVRGRMMFVARAITTAVIDAPSDHKDREGLTYGYRAGAEHAGDILRAVKALRERFHLPVWLVGTSRGTISAANAAVRMGADGADGVVLSASVGAVDFGRASVMHFELAKIRVPVLVAHHQGDGCPTTPARGARDIKDALTGAPRTGLLMFEGGDTQGNPCAGKSHHGFLGIEEKVIDAIARWMLNP